MNVILHSCKTVIIHNNKVRIKKNAKKSYFDVTMGSYHGAEACVGLILLIELNQFIPKENVGLYGDNGLLITKRTVKNYRKTQEKFNEQNLKIKIDLDSSKVDFFDVPLDIQNDYIICT